MRKYHFLFSFNYSNYGTTLFHNNGSILHITFKYPVTDSQLGNKKLKGNYRDDYRNN